MTDKEKIDSLEFVYNFYLKMRDSNVSLAYEGEITHQITKAFTALTESNMVNEEDYNTVQRKVFHVMVECLQNISKHAEPIGNLPASKDGRGIFMISKNAEEYNVTTGNVVSNDKIEELSEMLDNINSLDKIGLKQLYKQQIREGRLSPKGGAGLGFIDIVRKTGEKLVYEFLRINDHQSFFILISTISRKQQQDLES
jgi:hypothetical protein